MEVPELTFDSNDDLPTFNQLMLLGKNPDGTPIYKYSYQSDHEKQFVYIKLVRFDNKDSQRKKLILLKNACHQNLAKLLFIVERPERKLKLVFEYTGINLKEFIKTCPKVACDPIIIKWVIIQILCCVTHFHGRSICHEYLCGQNVLLNKSNGKLKVANIVVPCPSYMAPELLLGSRDYSFPADIWSVGCIFAEMVNRVPLFRGPSEHDAQLSIFRVLGRPTEETWPGVSALGTRINPIPEQPVGLSLLFPTLGTDGIDLLSKMLRMDPSKRISSIEALQHVFLRNSNLEIHEDFDLIQLC